jgi:hypothetical protein
MTLDLPNPSSSKAKGSVAQPPIFTMDATLDELLCAFKASNVPIPIDRRRREYVDYLSLA